MLRRPPKMIALTRTPAGSLTATSSTGLFDDGAVNRLLGCAAFPPVFAAISGVHSWPCQSIAFAGAGQSPSSHHTSYVPSSSGTRATFVKIVSRVIDAIALRLLLEFVPGTTPK